ncbi:MAG: hypothetical protein JJU29_15500 [Verrucomicrobia bacterium]|nr:hypothetical protein [Verrucomicrobiota bacterium]MCH8513599.1 hypothetical protein [Kiritimatiellia bacterium]
MRLLCFTLICWLGAVCSVGADYVELRDGRRLEGTILQETPEEIHIQVASNPDGTIRQIFVVHAREIRTWNVERDPDADADGDGPRGAEASERLSGTDYVQRILREAERHVADKQYDLAIEGFQDAVDTAGQEMPGQTPEQRVESLELRAHALRLLSAALEGKLNHLNTLARGTEDELRTERRRLEREWTELQENLRREEQARQRTGRIEIGQRHRPSEYEDVEKDLRQQIARLNQREANSAEFYRSLEEERVKTEALNRITRERITQATAEAREARRQLRRR